MSFVSGETDRKAGGITGTHALAACDKELFFTTICGGGCVTSAMVVRWEN